MQPPQLPARAGAGFKPEHFASIDMSRQPLGFFEIHAENYMGDGGVPHAQLSRLREDCATSRCSMIALARPGSPAAPEDAL